LTETLNYVLVLKPFPALIGVFADRKDAENSAGRRGGKVISGEHEFNEAAFKYGIGPVTPVGEEPARPHGPAERGLPPTSVIRDRDLFRDALKAAKVAPTRFARPTKAHRPAVWRTLLGVYGAEAPDGTAAFFDHDLHAALKHARLATAKAQAKHDLRIAAFRGVDEFLDGQDQPHDGQVALWAVR
jgi:hypothetical protein